MNRGADGKNESVLCTTGGTAGVTWYNDDPTQPDYSSHLVCGGGGYSYQCSGVIPVSESQFAGPGGQDGFNDSGKSLCL